MSHFFAAPGSKADVKMDPGLQMRVREAFTAGLFGKRFNMKKKRLSLDTPENRFIKFVLTSSVKKISRIINLAGGNEDLLQNQRLSKSFFENLLVKSNSLAKTGSHRLFQEVGSFTGTIRESLVLQQKPGYAKVYKAWQQLKWFLELLGDDASLSVRNVADIYEVWCFLQVRNILTELGFSEVLNKRTVLVNRGLEVTMKDGMAGAFKFQRADGITLTLAHEPVFREGTKPIRTWMTTQKPDIVLKAKFPDSSEITWIFDAKYRIDTESIEGADMVPDDAINQMHRYRDALIYQLKVDPTGFERSRPVFGAYVLYPGFYDQSSQLNPYQEAIEEIGIGAFSLLPSSDNSGSYWLHKFLESKLGAALHEYPEASSERFFVEDSVRIPYRGTKVTRYDNLTAVFSGRVFGRSEEYLERVSTGTLDCYHSRQLATDRQNIERHIVEELRYICIALSDDDVLESVGAIYPVKSVQLVKRGSLNATQTGTDVFDDVDQDYWYFELGKAIKLSSPLTHPVPDNFKVLLTSYDSVTSCAGWTEMSDLYNLLTR